MMKALPTTQELGVKGAKNFLKGYTLRPLPADARGTVMRLYGISSAAVDAILDEEAAKKAARRGRGKQKRSTKETISPKQMKSVRAHLKYAPRTVVKKKSWFESLFGGKR